VNLPRRTPAVSFRRLRLRGWTAPRRRTWLVGVCACLGLVPGFELSAQPANERVAIIYEAPKSSEHDELARMLKAERALERVQAVLSRVRWPQTLTLEIKGCNGEVNAWFENARITVCYEYLHWVWEQAKTSNRPLAISREDAFIGPFVDVFLHEAGHAIIDLLKIPVLGREEDAADQISAFYMLQLPSETKRRYILGTAYNYARELGIKSARDLTRRRLSLDRHITFADEHGTPAQRLFNLLCVAYGSEPALFADIVEKGFLPPSRAELCHVEAKQLEFAFRTLIGPHIDPAPQ
jgi:hypothetical protein